MSLAPRWIVPLAIAASCLPGTVSAQSSRFTDLPYVLTIGATVVVSDDAGDRVVGTVEDFSGSELILTTRRPQDQGSRLTLPAAAISRIVLRDSRRNGTIIGAVAAGAPAAALGFAVMAICDNEGGSGQCFLPVVGLVGGLTAAGALVGFGIDAMIERTIYAAPAGARITIAPLVSPTRQGALVSLRF